MVRFGHCPHCGNNVPLEIEHKSAEIVCSFCGEKIRLAEFEPYHVPEELQLEDEADHPAPVAGPWNHLAKKEKTKSGAFDFAELVPSEMKAVPAAAPPTLPKDPDKALTTFALGMFRVRGWPCQEMEGYKSFAVKAGFRNPETGQQDVCDVTVSARNGVLTLETELAPLPEPSLWAPVRETLNLMNARSGGSVFLLRESGVIVRIKVLPRAAELGAFSTRGILQALRQLNHDRRLAYTVMVDVLQSGMTDRNYIERRFAQPTAEGLSAAMTTAQLQDLAAFSGYYSYLHGDAVAVIRFACPLEECRVRMVVADAVIRGWAILDDNLTRVPTHAWTFVKHVIKSARESGEMPSRTMVGRLLERLNVLNDSAGLLRFIYSNGCVLAMSVYAPVEPEMSPEEFRQIADALLRCSSDDSEERREIRSAV
ncbi:MAG: TFIIB-type zinc ribbon-containing protein [Planctomycetes bacterium]|nr:TFIIB-type zinc ribbon-containing protein [Planctomycetota bacterium]